MNLNHKTGFKKKIIKKLSRFNGVSEKEILARTLPDLLAPNLDIIIIGINPGLYSAFKGHHYAGPSNHFWKCLNLSGLTPRPMSYEDDHRLLKFGIGFTNVVDRTTKSSIDLNKKEIMEGCKILLQKLQILRPKIAVFNGKLIYELFSHKRQFNYGVQDECIEGTDTRVWVMPSSSARSACYPSPSDKLQFYIGLKKLRDSLNGSISEINPEDYVFPSKSNKIAGTAVQNFESEYFKISSNVPSKACDINGLVSIEKKHFFENSDQEIEKNLKILRLICHRNV